MNKEFTAKPKKEYNAKAIKCVFFIKRGKKANG